MPTHSSALEFDDFSFWDNDIGFTIISEESVTTLLYYLLEHYGVDDMMMSGPYLVLFCKIVPDSEARPTTIAGCIAIWLSEDEELPYEIGLGDLAGADDLEVSGEILKDLKPYFLPDKATLLAISIYFPFAAYVTFLNTGLIVELPQQSTDDYRDALEKLPGGIVNSGITLGYHNGPLSSTKTLKTMVPNIRISVSGNDSVQA